MQNQKKPNQKYQTLLDNIPSGIHQCLNDSFFTMLEVNNGFLKMFGYSRKELEEQFGNHYINMVHPDDRSYVMEEFEKQLNIDEKVTLNYRICCKDGSFKYVMDSAQLIRNEKMEERVFCVLIDITESVEAREELRLTMERYQIVLNQATDIIFEWDLLKDTISYSGNWVKKFGYDPRYDGLGQEGVFRNIHPEDASLLNSAMVQVKKGKAFAEEEARVKNAEGRYIWCRIRATNQYDTSGAPIKAVGIITDIDEERRLIEDLKRRAELDALTGLYNREETERQIRRHLDSSPEEICALFMLDADNFKQVNDGYGHLFGDAVLTEMAAGMKKLTRQTDVVGRIGGDEFTIFLKNIPTKEIAVQKAEKLITMFQKLFQNDRQLFQVSCSIGIAIYPDDGENFSSLYRNADQALYKAKSRGKNQYVLSDSKNRFPISLSGYSSLGTAIDSDARDREIPENLVNYVFQVLYDTKDILNAIQLILEIVGKRFDVSRAFIFESSGDGEYVNNTFEWCNEGVPSAQNNLQQLPFDAIKGYKKLFRENSVLYCRDIYSLDADLVSILEPQGVRSLLHCAVMDQDKLCGIVGFDECTGLRMWTREEIGMLSLISQLITTFLLKKRVLDHDEQISQQLYTILDTQDAYIYALERGSFRLLYLNHKTKELDSNALIGMTCHQAFYNKNTPCEACPLSYGSGEFYNPRYDVWTKAKVSEMKWGNMDAYLVSCFDITEYKRMQSQDK